MQKTTFSLILLLLLVAGGVYAQQQKHTQRELTEVKDLMTGFFSTKNQWQEDTAYFYITLCMQPLWPESAPGYWLYVEQAAFAAPDRPYRQRVYHLFLHPNDDVIVSKVYEMVDPAYFVGACHDRGLLDLLTPEMLMERPGCELLLTRTADKVFAGATLPGACLSGWRGAAWVSSDVTITPDGLITWDRGWNEQGVQVWGPEDGGYRFDRIKHEEEPEDDFLLDENP